MGLDQRSTNAIAESMQTPDENQCAGGGYGKGIKEEPAADEDQRMHAKDGTTEESGIDRNVRPKLEWSTEFFVSSARAVSCSLLRHYGITCPFFRVLRLSLSHCFHLSLAFGCVRMPLSFSL